VWFSNFLSRLADTSVPNMPVLTDHSQTALPRSSNLTRPLLFLVTGASRFGDDEPPAFSASALAFGLSLLTLPF
jgi:hypothetical protein